MVSTVNILKFITDSVQRKISIICSFIRERERERERERSAFFISVISFPFIPFPLHSCR